MSNYPGLHSLVDCPAGGDIGTGTGSISLSACGMCRRSTAPIDYTIVEAVFDEWNGEDLVMTQGLYLASERLRSALDGAGVRGVTYEDTIVSATHDFELGPDAYQDSVPLFYRWYIRERLDGPPTWWVASGTCPSCGESAWEVDPKVSKAMQLEHWDDTLPRAVYQSSWSGVDVFLLKDPGPPIITDKVVEVFRELEVRDVELVPAVWVEA